MAVALYARVSTSRQAEKELSVPDQLRQMRAHCDAKHWVVAEEYVEDGVSAMSDRRPVFQSMIADACVRPSPFDAIVVHSLSRFFRDPIELGLYERQLAKYGVRLISISQQTSDDGSGIMMRRIFSVFDEYQSLENSKHTLRSMLENARQGYWNGAPPPYGYRAVEIEKNGRHGKKKRLEIEPDEADAVRLIYDIYSGKTLQPAEGMKSIARLLNRRGLTRRGKAWTGNQIFDILNNQIYQGELTFNRKNGKTKAAKAPSEWITVSVPPIVDESVRAAANAVRVARRPNACAPRQLSSPLLLAGLLRCGVCGAGMKLATGKSGRYRYYKCNNQINHGKAVCNNASPRVDALDRIVLDAIAAKVLEPAHLAELVKKVRRKEMGKNCEVPSKLANLKKDLAENKLATERLFEAVEKGILPADDLLRIRSNTLKGQRQQLLLEIARLSAAQNRPDLTIGAKRLGEFAHALKAKLTDPASDFSRSYLRLLVDQVTLLADAVTISGSKSRLAGYAAHFRSGHLDQVPGLVQKWLPETGSNRRPSD